MTLGQKVLRQIRFVQSGIMQVTAHLLNQLKWIEISSYLLCTALGGYILTVAFMCYLKK